MDRAECLSVCDMRNNTKPVTMRTDTVSSWRSLVQVSASGRPRLYPFSFILIMLLMIVVAGEVSKAFGVGFDSTASVQVDPRNVSMSPNRSSTKQVVIADNTRHLLASQLLDPFQLPTPVLPAQEWQAKARQQRCPCISRPQRGATRFREREHRPPRNSR